MKLRFILYILLFMGYSAYSQQRIEVKTGEKNMSQGQQMAVTVFIPEASLKFVDPLWRKYINNRSFGERIGTFATQVGNIFRSEENQVKKDKLKVEKKGDEWYVRSIEATNLSEHSMDVYARATDMPDGCQFSAFFQFTDSVFINESNVDAERIQNMKSFIYDFGVEVYKSVVDEQIKEAKKEVSEQEGIRKNIESDTRKEEKEITRSESDIQEYEAGILEVQNDIKRLEESNEAKKLILAGLTKDDAEYDYTKGVLKDIAKEKSKNFRKIKSLKGKIKSKELDIKKAKSNIVDNDIKVTDQQKVIEDKESIVEKLEDKKNNIK
ncbi:MAG: hypothetical protein WC384_10145 [Prolixibacteraceae bacterium]